MSLKTKALIPKLKRSVKVQALNMKSSPKSQTPFANPKPFKRSIETLSPKPIDSLGFGYSVTGVAASLALPRLGLGGFILASVLPSYPKGPST